MNRSAAYATGATLALVALIVLCVVEELWLAPLRPGGSWMVLKVIPLLFALRGVLKKDNYTLQWSSMLILLYFTEGIVRATSDKSALSAQLSWLEVVLCLVFFYCALCFLRPLKKAAKAAKAAAAIQETPPAS
jgi:uncharacterized membrane protein